MSAKRATSPIRKTGVPAIGKLLKPKAGGIRTAPGGPKPLHRGMTKAAKASPAKVARGFTMITDRRKRPKASGS